MLERSESMAEYQDREWQLCISAVENELPPLEFDVIAEKMEQALRRLLSETQDALTPLDIGRVFEEIRRVLHEEEDGFEDLTGEWNPDRDKVSFICLHEWPPEEVSDTGDPEVGLDDLLIEKCSAATFWPPHDGDMVPVSLPAGTEDRPSIQWS
jgi:hypothetical protein